MTNIFLNATSKLFPNVLRLGEVPTVNVNRRTKFNFGIAPKRCYLLGGFLAGNLIMNNVFKKEKSIELDANYSIETDKGNGVSLVFQEEREKENKITKLKEPFIFVERYCFNTVGQSLTKYIELSQNSSKDLKEVIEKTNTILSIVQDFRDKYKNW